jgi:polyhydroxyalkanoate synthesis repressor PhaR
LVQRTIAGPRAVAARKTRYKRHMRLRSPRSRATIVIKKYGNRRLYDTDLSRYVTLEELEDRIRRGDDVRVLDAKSNEDLTQQTLAQIILESRGAARLLPVPLLAQLIRMKDEALAEFFGRYVSTALELYLQARSGAEAVAPYVPLATVPFAASNALARMFLGATQMLPGQRRRTPVPDGPYAYPSPNFESHAYAHGPPIAEAADGELADERPDDRLEDDVAALRQELAELRAAVRDVARARSGDAAPAKSRPRGR